VNDAAAASLQPYGHDARPQGPLWAAIAIPGWDLGRIFNPEIPGLSVVAQSRDFGIENRQNYLTGTKKSP